MPNRRSFVSSLTRAGFALPVMNSGAFLNLKNSTVSGNTSTNRAGGVFAYNSSLLIENSTITGNSAGGFAGGVYFYGTASASPPVGFTPSTLVVRNSTIGKAVTAISVATALSPASRLSSSRLSDAGLGCSSCFYQH